MKKLLFIPAILALSTNFAFAIDLKQLVKLNQSIGNTSDGGFAKNKAFIFQGQFPVNGGNSNGGNSNSGWSNGGGSNGGKSSDFLQSVTLNQSIGDTSTGGVAINNAKIIQTQQQPNSW